MMVLLIIPTLLITRVNITIIIRRRCRQKRQTIRQKVRLQLTIATPKKPVHSH